MHGGRDYRLPSRFLAEIPPDAWPSRPGRDGRPSPWAAGRPARPCARPSLATGDNVLHATFGEGVVTAIESGGDLVRVRFAQDGAERRLMAGAAPMRKVS